MSLSEAYCRTVMRMGWCRTHSLCMPSTLLRNSGCPLNKSPELLHVELLPGAGSLVCFQAWELLGKPGTGCQSPLRQRVAVGALQGTTAVAAVLGSSVLDIFIWVPVRKLLGKPAAGCQSPLRQRVAVCILCIAGQLCLFSLSHLSSQSGSRHLGGGQPHVQGCRDALISDVAGSTQNVRIQQ